MCGITGLWHLKGLGANETYAIIRRMARTLSHRGPDDDGYWRDGKAGVALGHRRLSIIDLSPQGHQPMGSPSGRYVIVFNGEVYNHKRLRQELTSAGFGFRGHSDTEVMLAAIEHWGFETAVTRFNGMFAFALWDRAERTLTLARDRLGIKPLYYGWVGKLFVFGSELKAITAIPGFSNPIDRNALCLLLRHNYIAAPYSIYQNIHKLMPGTWLRVDRQLVEMTNDEAAMKSRTRAYWSARELAAAAIADPSQLSGAEAIGELDRVLRDAVALRMEADVPLGAFLSGGVDSSTVVALMQAQSSRPVKTFSIGFHEPGYNEAHHAKAVAEHLGTEHTELYVTPREALDVIPRLPTLYDEPFSDSSQIPTFLLSELTRRQVAVSLSGDGGDELFAGYGRYFRGRNLRRRLHRIPSILRRGGATHLRSHGNFYGALAERVMQFMPTHLRLGNPKSKVSALATLLELETDEDHYRLLVTHWRNASSVVLNSHELPTALTDFACQPMMDDIIERMMYMDLVSYLPDDILTKVDRASMAVALEARVPLLDHRVVEFAWRLPLDLKVKNGQGKWLLRQVLSQYVPKDLIERPKMGFGVPIDVWLRGPLRDWAEALLDERRLHDEGFFDPSPIRQMWLNHRDGKANEHYRLWDVLIFQSWLENSFRNESNYARTQDTLPSSCACTVPDT